MMTNTTHPYFVAKAESELARHGVGPEYAGPLAAWAQAHRDRCDIQGVLVAVDGEILGTTVHQEHAVYADDATIRRWKLMPHERGFVLSQLKRATGRDVILISRSDVCYGASRHRRV